MKKLLTGLLTAALMISFTTVSASARHHEAALSLVCGGLQTGCIRPACIGKWDGGHNCWDGHYCVDADNDGICDNYGHAHCPGNGACGNYADADGDGVCDNYDPEYCPGNGTGGGYVDSDGDGVCDNYDPEYCPGNGTGGNVNAGTGNGNGAGNGNGSGSVSQGYQGGGHHMGRGHGRHHS